MIKKALREAFVDDITKYILDVGGKYYGEDKFRLNNCTIHIHDESDHKQLYSIFARFDECNALSGRNPKYNAHISNTYGYEVALDLAKNHINNIKEYGA